MVKEVEKNTRKSEISGTNSIGKKKYYQCESCGFFYVDKEIAQKCEDFCEKYKSCSIEITKHAIQI